MNRAFYFEEEKVMKYKRILSLLLAFITVSTVFTAIPFTVSAAENSESIMVGASSGTTGDCTWTLNGTELIISGEGAMGDYHDLTDTHDTVARIETDAPWFGFQQNIKSVVIKHGVTSVGNYAFYCCLSLSSVTIPDTVTRIGDYAFGYCDSLNSITVPNSVLSIGEYAFDSNITVYGVTGGTTGGCKWMLMDGTMTISGNGAIPDYSSYKKVPWRAYESEIRNIRISLQESTCFI